MVTGRGKKRVCQTFSAESSSRAAGCSVTGHSE
uniref:Uncharacterized protein n=1 Tax=Anguilla anguilla TaxID=7936 RepID=A0A0E9TAE1_ANGAN